METYTLVQWPESQKYMDEHKDKIYLADYVEAGKCAYFVPTNLVKETENLVKETD